MTLKLFDWPFFVLLFAAQTAAVCARRLLLIALLWLGYGHVFGLFAGALRCTPRHDENLRTLAGPVERASVR